MRREGKVGVEMRVGSSIAREWKRRTKETRKKTRREKWIAMLTTIS